jgi:hypothetical protein
MKQTEITYTRLDEGLKAWFRADAANRGITLSALIREACQFYRDSRGGLKVDWAAPGSIGTGTGPKLPVVPFSQMIDHDLED